VDQNLAAIKKGTHPLQKRQEKRQEKRPVKPQAKPFRPKTAPSGRPSYAAVVTPIHNDLTESHMGDSANESGSGEGSEPVTSPAPSVVSPVDTNLLVQQLAQSNIMFQQQQIAMLQELTMLRNMIVQMQVTPLKPSKSEAESKSEAKSEVEA